MPCGSDKAINVPGGMTPIEIKQLDAVHNELHKVTRLLCAVLSNYEGEIPDEAKEWIKDHAAYDKTQGR